MRTEYRSWDAVGREAGPLHVRVDSDTGKQLWWEQGSHPRRLLYVPGMDIDPTQPVVLTEGEKAADAVREAGFQAIGTVCGAGTIPEDGVLYWLADLKIVLWPDRDAVGRKHMGRIGRALEAFGIAELRVVRVEGEDGQDAADLEPEEVFAIIDRVVWARPIGPVN